MIAHASQKHLGLRFQVHDLMQGPLDERFDYIVAADVAEHVPDPRRDDGGAGGHTHRPRIAVVVTANPLCPPSSTAERLNLKMPAGDHEWRSRSDLVSTGRRAGLRERSFTRSLLVPKEVPGIRALDSARWASGVRQRFGLIQRAVFEVAASS